MERFFKSFFSIKTLKFRNDDDFVDKLNRRHTMYFLLLFALITIANAYAGNPIQCWCPAHFTDTHRRYANTLCWVKNTYYIPMEEPLPGSKELDFRPGIKRVSYYQWVPMILLCQAACCYIPSMYWRFMCGQAGVKLGLILNAAVTGQRTSFVDQQEKNLRYMVQQIHRYLVARANKVKQCCKKSQHSICRACCADCSRFHTDFLSLAYLSAKLLYLANILGQLYLMDLFLGAGFHSFGVVVVMKFFTSEDWTFSERFPRVTMCDFYMRHMTVLHRYIIQCVLPINLFNEKIFIFVWFWYALMALFIFFSLVKWAWVLFYWPGQLSYITNSLSILEPNRRRRRKDVVMKFMKYLQRDGIFIIKLVSDNVGPVVAADLVNGLWAQHTSIPDPNSPGQQRHTRIRLNAWAAQLEDV